jgi:hypothetical protein
MALTGRFDADFQPFLDAVNQANKSLDSLDQSAKDLNTSMDKVTSGTSWVARITESDLLTDAIKRTLEALKDLAEYFPELAEHGAVVGDVADAFDHLTKQAGLTADVLLGDLRAGTHGTVDDFELMKRANENMAAGLNLTEDQFKLLADAAFALAKATGGDVKTALDTMSDAMVTGRAKGLQLLTGKIDLKAAEADYAASLAGTGQELTAEGKLEVDRETMLKRIGTALDALGPQQDSLKDKVDQAHVAWTNFQDDLGKVIARSPVLAAGLDTLRTSLMSAFGHDSEAAIKNIASLVDDAAIIVADFGLAAVVVADVVHSGWAILETVVLGVMTAISGTVSGIVAGWDKLATAANAISSHIVSAETVSTLSDVDTQMRAITTSLAAQTAEAAQAVIGHSALNTKLDTLGGTLFQTRDSLIAAQKAMDAHTVSATTNAAAVDKAAKSQQDYNDKLTPATQYTKQYVAAWESLNQTGVDYQATVDAMDPKLVEQINYYLKAGASIKTLAEAYPQATEAQITAIDTLRKKSEAAALDITKIWNEYTDLVGSGSQTAYEKAEAAIDKWYADDIAKHQASKTDTAAYYDAIAALDDAKYQHLATNRLADDKDSKLHLQNQAAADKEAYDFALQNQDQFSQEHIQKLRDTADASALAVARWGTGWKSATDIAGAAVDKLDASVKQTTIDLGAMQSVQFAGTPTPAQFAGMTTAQLQSAGLLDMYDQVTMAGQAAGLGTHGGVIASGAAPGRASGGPVTAGSSYLVGERGPELFVPASAGSILPNGSGMAVTVNITQPLGTPSAIAAAVSAALADALRRGGMRLPVQ